MRRRVEIGYPFPVRRGVGAAPVAALVVSMLAAGGAAIHCAKNIGTEGHSRAHAEAVLDQGRDAIRLHQAKPFTANERKALNAHSHNDYNREKPLVEAIENRFQSVEADIWPSQGEFKVSHWGLFFDGTLRDLYLEPLRQRVRQLGSVHGDGNPFILWLDIKSADPVQIAALHRLLREYQEMLTVFRDDAAERPGPVTVVLTGSEKVKKAYVDSYPTRYACRDSNAFSVSDPTADSRWCWYALKWSDYIAWDGQGTMPEQEKKKLIELVQVLHKTGRKLRFWGAPDRESVWREALAAQVDLIGTDEVQKLADFLTTSPRVPAAAGVKSF